MIDSKKIVLGITGGSGAHLGIRFAQNLPDDYLLHLVISHGARRVLEKESKSDLQDYFVSLGREVEFFDDGDLAASISSGSYGASKMAIIPTSSNTLGKVASGICDTLITRTASVMLKERRPLLLAVREMPFSGIMLENMRALNLHGAHIAPPIMGYYAAANLDEMERFIVGKWFDILGIEHSLFVRWGQR